MKKILSIFIIAFLLLGNTTFAEFSLETKLSVQKQESYKKQIDSVYKNFENKLSKLNEEKQISNIEKIVSKIEVMLKNKLSDKNNFVLSYLNYLLKEKLDSLNKVNEIDESIIFGNLFNDDDIKVESNKIVDNLKKVEIGEVFKVENVEYKILDIQIADHFDLVFSDKSPYYSQENPTYIEVNKQWKPKNNKFVFIKFNAKNLLFNENNINRDSVYINISIKGGDNKNYDSDINTAVNIGHLELFNKYSWGSDVSVPRDYFRVFDVENLDYSKSYLMFGDKIKLDLGFLKNQIQN